MLNKLICFIGTNHGERIQQRATLVNKFIKKTTIKILIYILSK